MPRKSEVKSSVIVLRHTRLAGASGLCYGRTEIPLATTAETDISEVIASLPAVERVVSSPAARCLQLAKTFAQSRGLALQLDVRWQELDFGHWEGLRWDDVPREALDAWAADSWHYVPGRGESAASLYARVTAALAELRAENSGNASRPVLVVTHAGPLRAACVIQGSLGFAAHFGIPAEPGGWIQLPL